jgi:hypothetical protein
LNPPSCRRLDASPAPGHADKLISAALRAGKEWVAEIPAFEGPYSLQRHIWLNLLCEESRRGAHLAPQRRQSGGAEAMGAANEAPPATSNAIKACEARRATPGYKKGDHHQF